MLKPTRTLTAQDLWLHGFWEDSLTRDYVGYHGAKCFSCMASMSRARRRWVNLAKARRDADGKGCTGLCPHCGLDALVETDRDRAALRLAKRHWLGPDGLQDWPSSLARSEVAWRAALVHQQRYLARSVEAGERLYRRHRVRWAIGGAPTFPGARGPIPPGWEPVVDRLLCELVVAGWNRQVLRCRALDDRFDFHLVELPRGVRGAIRRAHDRLGNRCQVCGRRGKARVRNDSFEDSTREAKLRDGFGGAQLLCDSCWRAEPLWPAEEVRWLSEAAKEWAYLWGTECVGEQSPCKHRHILYSLRLATNRKKEVEAFLSRLLRATETHALTIEPPSVVRGTFRTEDPDEQERCMAGLRRFLRNEKVVVEMAHGVRRLAR